MFDSRFRMVLLGFLVAAFLVPNGSAAAADPASLTGTVVDPTGEALAGAEVEVLELHRSARTAADGSFTIPDLPPGSYLVQVDGPSGESALVRVRIVADRATEVTLTAQIRAHAEAIVVSATADPRRLLEVAQPITILEGDELTLASAATLGETLRGQVGVASTYFGPGASRPVIRGHGGERVRTMENGLGIADVSATSPDHAVASDPLNVERIEILRGPAALRYGSTAIGGAVNMIDESIPVHRATEPISGIVELRADSVADERAGSVALRGGAGGFAWQAGYARRETDDIEIPGPAEIDEDEDEGHLDNSDLESQSGSVGLSWVGPAGYFGVAVAGFDTEYGVPGHEDHDEEENGDENGDDHGEDVRIDLERRHVELGGQLTRGFGIFRGLTGRVRVSDYEHVEIEDGEIETEFTNESVEGRLELIQRPFGALSGSVGVQYGRSDFGAEGEEAFVPSSVTDTAALFVFEELAVGDLQYQLGARLERQRVNPDGEPRDRSFTGVSGSLGAVWTVAPGWALAGSVARTERLPTATELYSDGPHLAIATFTIGDPDFDKEVNTGVDVSLKAEGGRVRGSLGLFASNYDRYIFEEFTGEEEDGLPVVQLVQRDAAFRGAELDLGAHLWHGNASDLDLNLQASYVRAKLDDTGEPLPRIPPLELGGELVWRTGLWRASGSVVWTDDQDRVGAEETPTDGYTLVGASVSRRLLLPGTVLDLILKGENLTDELARTHTSFLKDRVPLPGRNVRLIVRAAF